MPLIEGNQLLQRFHKRLAEATQVDIAVAWVKCCDALDALVGEGTVIRIAVGISGNVTDPCALECLNNSQSVDLRITRSRHGIFHPKYFCFHGRDRTICWVGSANLTKGGFGRNDELVHEFEDSAGEGRSWFESFWNTLHADPGPDLDEYNNRYQRRPQPAPSDGTPELLVPLPNQSTWNDFVEGLRIRNVRCRSQKLTDHRGVPWDILGNQHSYLHTISTARELARLPDWGNLKKPQCNILLGRDDDEGAWALLGSIWPNGKVAKVFNPTRMPTVGPAREKILHYVKQVQEATNNEIARVAHEAVREIWWNDDLLDGFGPAAATRLLTLARPDCLVSVNEKSAGGLAKLAVLERSTTPGSLANNYEVLLNWVHDQPWFKTPRPDDPGRKRDIWDCRAALLDAFVYEEING